MRQSKGFAIILLVEETRSIILSCHKPKIRSASTYRQERE